jgi:hypothetical protein
MVSIIHCREFIGWLSSAFIYKHRYEAALEKHLL